MRKIVPVLFGLGGFLLVAGLVAALWAPGVVKKTPIEVNTTTHLGGQAAKLNVATGELVTNPVLATSVTKSDTKVSDDKVIAWTNTSCLVIDEDNVPDCVDGDDPRLISATTDVFATDRVTTLAVNDGKYLPADAVKHEGIVNKFPFDSKKKSYPYWDGTAGKPLTARYDRTAKLNGLPTFVYKVTAESLPIDIAEGVPGTYDDVKEIYVEPRTGSIVNQTDDQQRSLADGKLVLDLQLGFTDDQIKTSVADTQDAISSLSLITRTVPIVGIVGGLALLIAGGVLMMRSRGARRA
ncbi:MAG: DUF3068 domain-containing protein [Marmoricola sp.]